MFDITTERTLSLTAATKILPLGRGGKRPHFSTLYRWVLTGAKSPDGRLVKLEAFRLGGAWYTSVEAVNRFVAALTPARDDARPEPATPRSPSARQHAAERAGKALTAAGI